MDERVYVASGVTPEALAEALRDPRLRLVYAERMEDTVLTWRDDWLQMPVALERWTYGRAFGEEAELRWQKSEDGYEVRAIAVGDAPAGIDWKVEPCDDWDERPGEQPLLLVGERDRDRPSPQPTWSEARIPRYLTYPVEAPAQATRVALVQRVYRRNGVVVTTRLLRVEEVPDG